MNRLTGAALLAGLLTAAHVAGAAAASGAVPTPLAIGPAYARGELRTAGQVDAYSVRLAAGQDLALGALGGAERSRRVEVVEPGGGVALAFEAGGAGVEGREFRARLSGEHLVRVAGAPGGYALRLDRDCPNSVGTRCRTGPGQRQAKSWTYYYDVDDTQVAMRAGRTYALEVESSSRGLPGVDLRDGSNRTVAGCRPRRVGGRSACALTFRPRAGGTYHALVYSRNGAEALDYALSLVER